MLENAEDKGRSHADEDDCGNQWQIRRIGLDRFSMALIPGYQHKRRNEDGDNHRNGVDEHQLQAVDRSHANGQYLDRFLMGKSQEEGGQSKRQQASFGILFVRMAMTKFGNTGPESWENTIIRCCVFLVV